MKQIILASASPRRKELLEQLGLSFEIMPSHKEEIVTTTLPADVVIELSKQKAIGFLVGQTMKAMQGKADPGMVNQILKELLDA